MIDAYDASTDNGIIEKYCYHNDTANCNIYGGFYQWDEMMQYTMIEGAGGICPSGWHIPALSEFQILQATLDNDGNSLKAIGQGTGDGAGTNTTGFSALLTGYRREDGYIDHLGDFTIFWSSTWGDSSWGADGIELYKNISSIVGAYNFYKEYGLSVRCIKDLVITQNIPCPGTPTVEYEGKIYNTVQIGSQCWLKENLNVGEMILGVDTAKDNNIIEKYCYNNDTANCAVYGGLYQWNEAMQYSTTEGAGGICPSGWHIPTSVEFQVLFNTDGGDGNALKAIGQGDSTELGDGRGTNTSGFSALLSGFLYTGASNSLSSEAYFWSSTENSSKSVYGMYLSDYSNYINVKAYFTKEFGFNVRCLKN
jgi:uncharacterized protein (TIGR02145 family)